MNNDHRGIRLSAAASRVPGSAIRALLADSTWPGMISLAGGSPNPDLFDSVELATALDGVLSTSAASALQYGATEGQPRLRAVLQNVMRTRGVDAAFDTLVITSGSQQALDLLSRSLLDPGDVIAVDQPTYLAALQTFQLSGATPVTLPRTPDGIDFDALERLQPKPKALYLVPNFANPTGATLDLETRVRLLEWARSRHVFLIEDDPYGELYFDAPPPPPIIALARRVPGASGWCGYLSTLSKVIAPALRIGWMVLPPQLADATMRIKQAADLQTSSLLQEAVARYLERGSLSTRLPRLRDAYAQQARALALELRTRFGEELRFNEPAGGLFLWARLPPGTDTHHLLAHARDRNVIFVPGASFYAQVPDATALRLSYANCSPAQLGVAAMRLHDAYRAYLVSGKPAVIDDVRVGATSALP